MSCHSLGARGALLPVLLVLASVAWAEEIPEYLTERFLTYGTWSELTGEGPNGIEFGVDARGVRRFRVTGRLSSEPYASGTWEIQNGAVWIYVARWQGAFSSPTHWVRQRLTDLAESGLRLYREDGTDIPFSLASSSDERKAELGRFRRIDVSVPSLVDVDGMAVLPVHKQAITTANLRPRTGPGLSYDTFEIAVFEGEPSGGALIPDRTVVYVWGRTEDRYRVDHWKKHWFLIQGSGFSSWVFGEFINFEIPPRAVDWPSEGG